MRATPKTTTRSHRIGDTKPRGLVLNEKGLYNFKSIAYENRNVEFLYLRENEFQKFEPYIQMPELKVLDLSINSLEGHIEFLPELPNLRHLYVTGNRLTSLEGIHSAQMLETLCASDNEIKSFVGLDNLPNLRVLSLTSNAIESFAQYPYLPSLHTLALQNNPIAGASSYRKMAIAASPPSLAKLDKIDVTPDERQAVDFYKGKVVYCIAEGLVIEGDQVEEQAEQFLLDMQRKTFAAKPLKLQYIGLEPADEGRSVIVEGRPVKLHVCLQDVRDLQTRRADVFVSDYVYPVAFKVLGNSTEVHTVGSMNKWGGPLPMERGEDGDETFFQTTLYLPAGSHEYRYIVDGMEKVDSSQPSASKHKQGLCNVHHVVPAKHEDVDHRQVIIVRWMRSTDNNGFDIIDGVSSLEYTPDARDVGRCLRGEVLVYENQEFSFMYFDISSPVAPGAPSCQKLEVLGTPAEGELLTVEAIYQGGQEGHSILQWFAIDEEDQETPLQVDDPWAGISCSLHDVGKRIKVEYTPIRVDGEAGDKVSKIVGPIAAGIPTCRAIRVEGSLIEGQPLTCVVEYSGGYEGHSQFQWFRVDDTSGSVIALAGHTSATYDPTADDVNRRLAVEYTPVSRDGIRGEASRCTVSKPIVAGEPQIRNLAFIITKLHEEHTIQLQFQYFGGRPSKHIIQWFATSKDDGKVAKFGRGGPTATLTAKEVGSIISVEITPVRDDGVTGQIARLSTKEAVQPAEPKLLNIRIGVKGRTDPKAAFKVGDTLTCLADYVGGREGESKIRWWREEPGAEGGYVIVQEDKKEYVIQQEDVGRIIKVTYVPIRVDGVQGEMKDRLIEVEKPADAPAPAPAAAAEPAPAPAAQPAPAPAAEPAPAPAAEPAPAPAAEPAPAPAAEPAPAPAAATQ